MIGETELGESREKLTAPQAVVLLLVVENDEDVIADAQALEHRGGERLCCDRKAEIFF